MDKQNGYTCECCGQYVKEYKRRLYKSPVLALINLYKLDRLEPNLYHHIQEIGATIGNGIGDFAKARYWGLITAMPNDDEDKKTSGYWAITRRGRQFVQGRLRLFKYCHVYNSEVVRFSGDTIYVQDALGVKFSYKELMNA